MLGTTFCMHVLCVSHQQVSWAACSSPAGIEQGMFCMHGLWPTDWQQAHRERLTQGRLSPHVSAGG